MNLSSWPRVGVQRNAISPTPQQHYDFFEGTGASLLSVAADGSVPAQPSQKVQVYQKVADSYFTGSECILINTSDAPWRTGDYRHLFTTIEVGNDTVIPDAYAVRNVDGRSLNKDRLNLIGCDETDADGNAYYPSQVRYQFSGVEYIQVDLIGRNGNVINSANETDRLNDGANSIDISGIDPHHGYGFEKRPSCVRVSYLLHAVDSQEKDETDYDNDSDLEETLADAIRTMVANEGLSTRIEQMESYRSHASQFGFAGFIITQSIQLGY